MSSDAFPTMSDAVAAHQSLADSLYRFARTARKLGRSLEFFSRVLEVTDDCWWARRPYLWLRIAMLRGILDGVHFDGWGYQDG